MDRFLVVFIGGGAGALARYAASLAIMTRFGYRFPLGTFLINLTGSFLIGLLMSLFMDRIPVHPNWRLALITGFLGGYTTFSSFEYETLMAVRTGAPWIAASNVFGSVVGGFAAVWLGSELGKR